MRTTPALVAVVAAACVLPVTAACSASTGSGSTPSPTASVPPSTPSPTASATPTPTAAPAPEPAPTAPADGTDGAPPAAGGLPVELTYAGLPAGGSGYEAAGLVPGVVEDGGTCTFRFAMGGDVVEQRTEGLADASSTSCGRAEVPFSRLGSGTWQVTLRYSGAAGQGTSAVTEVVVP